MREGERRWAVSSTIGESERASSTYERGSSARTKLFVSRDLPSSILFLSLFFYSLHFFLSFPFLSFPFLSFPFLSFPFVSFLRLFSSFFPSSEIRTVTFSISFSLVVLRYACFPPEQDLLLVGTHCNAHPLYYYNGNLRESGLATNWPIYVISWHRTRTPDPVVAFINAD